MRGASSSRAGRTACRGRGSRVRLRHHRRPRRNAVPCGRLFYDAERDEWGIQIAEGAGPEEVPFLFSSFVERGERAIGPAWARRWVAERVVPPGRQNLGEVLRANGLREYSEFALLAIGKGACSQDYFVLRGPFPVDDDGEILDDRAPVAPVHRARGGRGAPRAGYDAETAGREGPGGSGPSSAAWSEVAPTSPPIFWRMWPAPWECVWK